MLDHEPTGSAAEPTAGGQGGESTERPSDATAEATTPTTGPPAKATKATRAKKATKATKAPEDAEAAETGKAPRTRTRRKPAPAQAAGAGSQPPAGAEPASEAQPAGAVPASGAAETREASASRTRAAAPATAPLFLAPDSAHEPAQTEEPAASAPKRRRSRRTTGQAGADHAVADAEGSAAPAATDAGTAETDGDAGTAEADTGTQAGGTARSRRRGRRGRGRGKGAQDAIDDAETSDAETSDAETSDAETSQAETSQAETSEESVEESTALAAAGEADDEGGEEEAAAGTVKRRRRRRRRKDSDEAEPAEDDASAGVKLRDGRGGDEVRGVTGSTRLEAKRQRRRGGRDQRRTRPSVLSESEFLARRESVDRVMVIRETGGRTQIGVLEDGILVEHYVSRATGTSIAGSVYLGKVQNVLPSMEAAFVDVGRGRNAVLYAGEVNWDVAGLEGKSRSIEQALKSGDSVMVQVTKDPVGHKGARLTSHIALSGRHLVYVPNGNASGISRKLPDNERRRLRNALKSLVPEGAGVIVRTAAEGASEDELARDIKRLQRQWDDIQAKAARGNAPALLYAEPDLVVRVVRDLFNEDFRELVIQGDEAYETVEAYLAHVSPDLVGRLRRHPGGSDVFTEYRVDEQILKGLDRKVYLPSGGHLVIDRTEAMTVIDVNTGKYTGTGGNLEETVTRNNLEAAEEIVRQLRLRDIGGIIVIDFIDMVLESNRELVLRRLTECLGRDRTKHQVTEITSLGLVQMTRKRVGAGLLEAFSETCECCKGRGVVVHLDSPADKPKTRDAAEKVKAVASASGPAAGSGRGAGAGAATGNGGRRRVAKRPAGPPEPAAAPAGASAPAPSSPAAEQEPMVAEPVEVDSTPGATLSTHADREATDEVGTGAGASEATGHDRDPSAVRLSDEGLGGVLRRFRRGSRRSRS